MVELVFLEEFGKAFVPKKLRPRLGKYLAKAGIDDVPYKFFGSLFFLTAIVTYFVYVPGIYPIIKSSAKIVFFLATFSSWFVIQLLLVALVILGIMFYLNMKIYNRTKVMEEMLPDYLAFVATNLKGGMNFEKALWAAIKPEFGILSNEIGIVSKKVATGNDVGDALEEFAEKYNSPILRRSIDLLKGELISGGSVAQVIDSIVDNLKRTKDLKQEMVATTLTYMIFMAAIVIVITPALFALSKQLLNIILKLGSKLNTSLSGSTSSGIISFSVGGINPDQFTAFSVAAIAIIAVFTSMIISIIEKGDVRGGLKYIPLFLVSALILYFIFSVVLETVMSGMVMT